MNTESLPIHGILSTLHEILTVDDCVVLAAQPGAGKSTQVPLSLLSSSWVTGKILILEPRRVAVKSIAHYLAYQLGESVGHTVGYQIRHERNVSQQTRIEVITEGILTRRLQSDPELADVSVVIFDEFHERAVHADLALLLCREVQEGLRDDLRVLVMSATMDTLSVSDYLGGARVIDCPGRSFPVEISYHPPKLSKHQSMNRLSNRDIASMVSDALEHALVQLSDHGDVLVFLPSQGAIHAAMNQCETLLKGQSHITCHALYGAMSLSAQEQIIRPSSVLHSPASSSYATASESVSSNPPRRIIFATNIAETSVTIPNVTMVIDTGLEKSALFDVKSGLTKLVTQRIAKSSADQRAGRAGRVQAGHCIRLWSETQQYQLADFAPLAINNTDLSAFTLELSAWGIHDPLTANWLDTPPTAHIEHALQLNTSLALIQSQGQLSTKGQQLLDMGIEPRLGAMLLSADSTVEQALACVLAALLTERDIANDPAFVQQHFGVDVLARLSAVIHTLITSRSSKGSLHHIQQLALRWFGQITGNIQTTHSRQAFYDALGQISDVATMSARLCAVAFVDRIAKRRAADPDLSQKISYTMANGRGVSLMPNEPLASSLWLVIVDCDGQNNDGRVFLALAVNEAVIMQLDSVNTENVYEYSAANNKITGRRQTRIGQLVINETPLSTIPDDVLIPCFMQVVAEQGLRFLQWDKRCEQWCLRVQWLAEYCPDELPLIDEAYLLRHLNDWLLPYCHGIKTIRQLQQLALMPLLEAILTYEQQQFLAKHAPVKYTAPSGLSCHITYSKHQAPSVHIVLQEMFGQLTSPLLANGQVPLCFTLLPPARRDLQTTSDLAHFWTHSYFDVRKDMKGRYPKHRWPEKPLEELPGRSIKPKNTT